MSNADASGAIAIAPYAQTIHLSPSPTCGRVPRRGGRGNGVNHNRYQLYNPRNGSLFTDLLEINVLELPKLPEETDGSPLYLWAQFFRATQEEEFEMLAKKDEAIGTAVGRLKELSRDESLRMLAESRQLAQWDEESRLRGARREGWQEGRQEGMFAVARKALSEHLPLPTIQILTGLSQDEIMGLSFEGQQKH